MYLYSEDGKNVFKLLCAHILRNPGEERFNITRPAISLRRWAHIARYLQKKKGIKVGLSLDVVRAEGYIIVLRKPILSHPTRKECKFLSDDNGWRSIAMNIKRDGDSDQPLYEGV